MSASFRRAPYRAGSGGAASSSPPLISSPSAGGGAAATPLSSFLYAQQQPRHQLVVRVVVTALCVLIVGMCVVFVVLSSVPLGMPRRRSGGERYGKVTTWDGSSVSAMRDMRNKRNYSYYYSFEAYESFEAAKEDMSRRSERGGDESGRGRKSVHDGDDTNEEESMYGAVHLCATEDARRSSFPSYIVIPSHEMYYSDRDVKVWETDDERRFKERQEALGNGNEEAAEKFKYSLSAIGKNNLRRYGGFGGHLKLTIFEVEVCSKARCPYASGIAILGVLESHATQMARARDNEWTAYNSPMAKKLNEKVR